MVKHYKEQIRKEELCQEQKLIEKAQLLTQLRRRDFLKDTKRNCIKRSVEFVKPKINVHEFLVSNTTEKLPSSSDQTKKEVHSFKTALLNSENVLKLLEAMKVKNDRPADYLVEMYKSDKQMFKVRRYLTEKEQKIKEKMQGKDWEGKNKKRQKMKKKAEAKRAHKKQKTDVKRSFKAKPKIEKKNGERKVKKSFKK